MAIDTALIKFFKCAVFTEGDGHGGDIDLGQEITSGVDQNLFDDVTNQERIEGDTEYRKFFIRNENVDTWNAIKSWINENTPATNDQVSILLGGIMSKQGVAVQLTGTATFEAGTAVVGDGTLFLTEVAVGEKVYNSTNDAEDDSVAIASITDDTHLTLASAYSGTGGAIKNISVARITYSIFVLPDSKSHVDVLVAGDIIQDDYKGIWIKRIVDVGGAGYTNNTFTLGFESS